VRPQRRTRWTPRAARSPNGHGAQSQHIDGADQARAALGPVPDVVGERLGGELLTTKRSGLILESKRLPHTFVTLLAQLAALLAVRRTGVVYGTDAACSFSDPALDRVDNATSVDRCAGAEVEQADVRTTPVQP
jgi:hypothetical protein